MKKLLITFAISIFSVVLYAQIQDETANLNLNKTIHHKKDVSISASPNFLLNTLKGDILAGGLKIRMFVGERVSLDSDIMFGSNFMQLAPGIIGIPAILLGYQLGFGSEEEDKTLTEFVIMGVLMILSLEHVAYHIPVKGKTDISPYVSLLRYRQFRNVATSLNDDKIEGSACFAVGLEVNKYFNKFLLSPYADYSVGYAGPIRGFAFGINFGYSFSYR